MDAGRGAERSRLLATPLSNRLRLRHSLVAAQCTVFSRYVRSCFWVLLQPLTDRDAEEDHKHRESSRKRRENLTVAVKLGGLLHDIDNL